MREPPESHKQRFYKLPQVSWSWVATLIVYWGDFSSEGYYLHIRNSYTFKSSWWTSAFFIVVAAFSSNNRQKSYLLQSNDLRLWDKYVGGVSGHHLSSTWRASYKLFSIGWKMYTLQFQTEHGLSRSFFVQSEKYFLFRCAGAYVDPDVWVSKSFTSMRKCWSIHMLKYVKVRQHNLLKLSKKRVGEDESRSVNSDNDALD